MSIHDWSRVEDGIFHHFHQDWITEISRSLNSGLLPRNYYALSEQRAVGLGPDVLTLKSSIGSGANGHAVASSTEDDGGVGVLIEKPRIRMTMESDRAFYLRKESVVTVRHAEGDELVAVIELVSRGNKSGQIRFSRFVEKAVALIMDYDINVLVVDLHPPTARDPQGIHGAIWEHAVEQPYTAPPDKPLTLVSYESDDPVRAYIEPVAVGDSMKDMPLFLRPGAHILVPLEATYNSAFAAMPKRWRDVLQPTT